MSSTLTGHQNGRPFIVLGHQYGPYDIMWKQSKIRAIWFVVDLFLTKTSPVKKGYFLNCVPKITY